MDQLCTIFHRSRKMALHKENYPCRSRSNALMLFNPATKAEYRFIDSTLKENKIKNGTRLYLYYSWAKNLSFAARTHRGYIKWFYQRENKAWQVLFFYHNFKTTGLNKVTQFFQVAIGFHASWPWKGNDTNLQLRYSCSAISNKTVPLFQVCGWFEGVFRLLR